jgi:hypothetical protein
MPTSHYCFSTGPHSKRGHAALRDTLMAIAGKAFTEDRTIIEAQQLNIAARPGPCGSNKTLTVGNPL